MTLNFFLTGRLPVQPSRVTPKLRKLMVTLTRKKKYGNTLETKDEDTFNEEG